jgi:hypothetical protein
MHEQREAEQFLGLDEEQLQAITGGTGSGEQIHTTPDQAMTWHFHTSKEDAEMAKLAEDRGLHGISEEFSKMAAHHLEKVNTLTKRVNQQKELERKSLWPRIEWR